MMVLGSKILSDEEETRKVKRRISEVVGEEGDIEKNRNRVM
jgi:hypothetical protein